MWAFSCPRCGQPCHSPIRSCGLSETRKEIQITMLASQGMPRLQCLQHQSKIPVPSQVRSFASLQRKFLALLARQDPVAVCRPVPQCWTQKSPQHPEGFQVLTGSRASEPYRALRGRESPDPVRSLYVGPGGPSWPGLGLANSEA